MSETRAAALDQLHEFVRRYGRLEQGQQLDDRTPLLEERVLTSLQIPELLLLIESIRGEEIDVLDLKPGDFRDLATIVERFLS